MLSVLIVLCLLCACSNSTDIKENDAQISVPEEKPGETLPVPENIPESGDDDIPEETIPVSTEKPSFGDFEHIRLYDEDSSPIIAMTEKERAEFLEIIGAYDIKLTEEIDPAIGTMDRSISFTSEEKGAVLYIKELAGEGLISMKWNRQLDMEAFDVSGDIYYDLEDLRNKIQKNARKDGRWPFLFPEEETFLHADYPLNFDEEHFRKEFETVIDCIIGDYDSEENRLGPERVWHYCFWKVLRDYNARGEDLPYNDDGQTLVPEEDVDRIAKYVFGISEFSDYIPSENGYYTAPFGARITNTRITDIRIDGSYVFCDVIFTDPGDVNFEWEPIAKKTYCFIFFEAEGETFYRAVSSRCEFGEEYGF